MVKYNHSHTAYHTAYHTPSSHTLHLPSSHTTLRPLFLKPLSISPQSSHFLNTPHHTSPTDRGRTVDAFVLSQGPGYGKFSPTSTRRSFYASSMNAISAVNRPIDRKQARNRSGHCVPASPCPHSTGQQRHQDIFQCCRS